MAHQIRDRKSKALIFHQTQDEKGVVNIRRENKMLKNDLKKMEEKMDEIINILKEKNN